MRLNLRLLALFGNTLEPRKRIDAGLTPQQREELRRGSRAAR